MTRADLAPGQQIAQVAHAPHELALTWLAVDAAPHLPAAVHEPDLGGALTALAPAPPAARLLSHLPLAGTPVPGLAARGGEKT